jgi:hypothetical protein
LLTIKQRAWAKLKDCYDEILLQGHNAVAEQGVEVLEASRPPEKELTSLERCFQGGSSTAAMSGFEKYRIAPALPVGECPLLWWKANCKSYPRIATLARKYLCIPATSIPSERVFSTAGNVIAEKRNRLSPEHASAIIYLHENAK